MESIIRVIKGTDEGTTAALLPGQTVLGRGAKSGLKLTPPSVSWEHAVIFRDRDDYFVENLSAHGTLINDSKITGKVRLRPRDVLTLSDDAIIRFEPAGMPQGLLARRNMLVMAIVLVALVGGTLMFWNPFVPKTAPANWDRTQSLLLVWLAGQVKGGQLPPDAEQFFRRAWELNQAGDHPAALAQWLRMRLLLDSLESTHHFKDLAAQDRNALDRVNTALPNSPDASFENDDEAAAVLEEFVQRYLEWTARQAAGEK